MWLKKAKASNNFKCMTICHRCVNPVAAQEHRDDVWIHLDLLIKKALISLLCTASSGAGLLERARPPHHAAHCQINRTADASRKTSRLRCSCDHTKDVLEQYKDSTVNKQFCHLNVSSTPMFHVAQLAYPHECATESNYYCHVMRWNIAVTMTHLCPNIN